MATAKVWLSIEPQWRQARSGEHQVVGMSVVSVLKNRPQKISGVAVEITLNIPDQAFMPLRPVVTIDVPEEALHYEPEVSVEFPSVETSP